MERATKNGKWWEAEHDDDPLYAYIKRLEQIVDQQDHTHRLQKISTVGEFLGECKETLAFNEFVFLCLRIAGYKYPAMEREAKSLLRKDSTMHRKVQSAIKKIGVDLPLAQKKKDRVG